MPKYSLIHAEISNGCIQSQIVPSFQTTKKVEWYVTKQRGVFAYALFKITNWELINDSNSESLFLHYKVLVFLKFFPVVMQMTTHGPFSYRTFLH